MRLCKVCTLPPKMRAKIDAALVDGTTYDRIVARFSRPDRPINTMNLSRHRRHLLPKELVRRAPAPEPEVALSLLQRVESLVAESKQIAAAAKTGQQWMAATSALREVRCCIELLGKLTGEISPANFNFNNFNFANVSEEQIAAFWEALQQAQNARARQLLEARMGLRPPDIHVHFVTAPPMPESGLLSLEAPANGNGNGQA